MAVRDIKNKAEEWYSVLALEVLALEMRRIETGT
jgi:hypothetical protein